MKRRLYKILLQHRCGVLLVSLLLMLLLSPFTREDRIGRLILSLLATFAVVSALYALARNRRELIVGIVLGFLALTGTWSFFGANTYAINIGHDLATGTFYVYTAFMLFRHILVHEKEKVDSEVLFAAICIYLFIGIGWADAYHVMEIVSPGSYVLSALVEEPQPVGRANLLYFSFTTLTTLGYGDILPTHEGARSLAILEAIVGVLYIAVMVSRIAGLYRRSDD